jgi:hypothetical protein
MLTYVVFYLFIERNQALWKPTAYSLKVSKEEHFMQDKKRKKGAVWQQAAMRQFLFSLENDHALHP